MVPRRFVATRFGIDFARIAAPDGHVVEVAVQVAPGPAADEVEILSGLAAGDVVVAPPRVLAQGVPR